MNKPPEYLSSSNLLRLKPEFFNVLKSVGVNQDSLPFNQILLNLKNYIKQEKLYDQHDPRIINCNGNPLSSVFGSDKFLISDVLKLVMQNVSVLQNSPKKSTSIISPGCEEFSKNACNGKITETLNVSNISPEPKNTSRFKRKRRQSLTLFYSGDSSKDNWPWFFQVEVEDTDSSEVLSVQSKSTVPVQDSTDDLWFLESDDENDTNFDTTISDSCFIDPPFSEEYEPVSPALSSTTNEMFVIRNDSDVPFWGDSESSDGEFTDPELTTEDKWTCLVCKHLNNPLWRHCERCWKLRPHWLSNNPYAASGNKCHQKKPQRTSDDTFSSREDTLGQSDCFNSTQKINNSKIVNSLNTDTSFNLDTDLNPQNSKKTFAQPQTTQTNSQNSEFVITPNKQFGESKIDDTKVPDTSLCIVCFSNPKEASLIHGKTGHQAVCYKCGKRLKRSRKACPVCRKPIQKVIKNYLV